MPSTDGSLVKYEKAVKKGPHKYRERRHKRKFSAADGRYEYCWWQSRPSLCCLFALICIVFYLCSMAFRSINLCLESRKHNIDYHWVENFRGNVTGQILALNSLTNHLKTIKFERSLTLIFLGSVGVGKSHVSHLLSRSLHSSSNRNVIVPREDFGGLESSLLVYHYLKKQLGCGINFFEYEEILDAEHYVQEGILMFLQLVPSMEDPLISIFNLNVPLEGFVAKIRELEAMGIKRDDVTAEELDIDIGKADEFLQLLREIDVPYKLVWFLPLEKEHAIQCLKLSLTSLKVNEHTVLRFLENLEYSDAEKRFVKYGCKKLGLHILDNQE